MMRQRWKRRLVDEVRYESERWPLWRWDLNLRYLAKSMLHVTEPRCAADRDYWQQWRRWLPEALARGTAATTIAAVGDLMWLRQGYADFLSPGVRALLQRSRALLGNLETPIDSTRPVRRWVYETLRYNAPESYLDALTALERDRVVLSLCNNHALDQGVPGLTRTRAALLQRGFTCLGGPGTLDDAVGVFEVDGVRLACIATTFGINHDEANAPAGVPVVGFGDRVRATDWDRVRALIDCARAHEPELIVLMPHWGFEYEYWPDAGMRAAALRLVELGVDVILGSSPHVLQPVDVVSVDGWDERAPMQARRNGAPRAAVVAYSLGNFASVMPTLGCRAGGVLELSIARDAAGVVSALPRHFHPTISLHGHRGNPLATGASLLFEAPPRLQSAARHAARVLPEINHE